MLITKRQTCRAHAHTLSLVWTGTALRPLRQSRRLALPRQTTRRTCSIPQTNSLGAIPVIQVRHHRRRTGEYPLTIYSNTVFFKKKPLVHDHAILDIQTLPRQGGMSQQSRLASQNAPRLRISPFRRLSTPTTSSASALQLSPPAEQPLADLMDTPITTSLTTRESFHPHSKSPRGRPYT